MNRILKRIARHARQQPDQPALADGDRTLSYRALQAEVERLSELLQGRRIALLLANSCAWAALDLAVLRRGAACIPLPPFFSDAQLAHVVEDARPDLVITDQPERLQTVLGVAPVMQLAVAGRRVTWFTLPEARRTAYPPYTAKLTYTSGTTGRPKGVCLSASAMERVTLSLTRAADAGPNDRSLSLLPLSTLLENIAGLYAPLYSGAQACVPDLVECGMAGSSGLDPARLMGSLGRFRPSSTVVVPQLLKAMVEALEAGARLPAGLRFVAVGGARTAPALIARARSRGLPVYQGYGLSEACSVVTLNRPGDDRVTSVGRPLAHVDLRIAEDGEVVVSGALFSGYLGERDRPPREWRTGDLGYLDADGYLHITGRKHTAYATAFGRNVAPDWVESELQAGSAVLQAAVLGAGRPFNVAVLVPHPCATAAAVAAAVTETNARLPDYARVRGWLLAREPFTSHNGLATGTGAVDRRAVAAAYTARIEKLYEDEQSHAHV